MSRCRRDAAQDVGKERRVRALDGFVALLGREAQRDELVDDAVEVGPGEVHLVERLHGRRARRGARVRRRPWLALGLRHAVSSTNARDSASEAPGTRGPHRRPCRRVRRARPSPGPRSRRSGCRCRPAHGGARRPPSARSWRCCRRCRSAMSRRGLRSRARRRRQSGRCPRSPGSVRRRRPAPVPAGSRARRAR